MAQIKKYTPYIPTIKEIPDLVDENRRDLAQKLVNRAVFMEKTLKKLEKQVKEEGAVISCKNGNGFDTTMEHPAQKSYNTMIGKYNALMKTIIDMIPEKIGGDDELMDFIKKQK